MTTDLTLYLSDKPGALAKVGELLGRNGINIEGVCGTTRGGAPAEIHVLVADRDAAVNALRAEGISAAFATDVAVIPVEDRPGVLGELSQKLAAAGVNITLVYLATNTRLVIGTDNLDNATAVLGS